MPVACGLTVSHPLPTPHAHFPYSSPLGMVGHCVSTDSQCRAVGGQSWQLCCHFGSRWSASVWEGYFSGEFHVFWLWHCLLVLAEAIPLACTWTHADTVSTSVHSPLPFVYIYVVHTNTDTHPHIMMSYPPPPWFITGNSPGSKATTQWPEQIWEDQQHHQTVQAELHVSSLQLFQAVPTQLESACSHSMLWILLRCWNILLSVWRVRMCMCVCHVFTHKLVAVTCSHVVTEHVHCLKVCPCVYGMQYAVYAAACCCCNAYACHGFYNMIYLSCNRV